MVEFRFKLTNDQKGQIRKALADGKKQLYLEISHDQLIGGNSKTDISKQMLRRLTKVYNNKTSSKELFKSKQLKDLLGQNGGLAPAAVLTAAETGMSLFNDATAENQARVSNKIQRRIAKLQRGKGLTKQDEAFQEGIAAAIEQIANVKEGKGINISYGAGMEGSGFFSDFVDGFAYGFNPANWGEIAKLAASEIDHAIDSGKGLNEGNGFLRDVAKVVATPFTIAGDTIEKAIEPDREKRIKKKMAQKEGFKSFFLKKKEGQGIAIF